nr:DUF342 domain-containing protein [Desulfobulbaceae bacterium]
MDSNNERKSMADENIDALVTRVAKSIHASISLNFTTTKAKMRLPKVQDCDPEILALAIERLLTHSFKFSLPGKVLMKLKNGDSVKFSVKPQNELPPLTIIVFLDPNKQQLLSIQGCEPTNGLNGFSVLVFHWQRESGSVDAKGNIDLKKVNNLPAARAGDLLAKIYTHTDGHPGINCYGKRINQANGIPIEVKWDEDSVVKTDEPVGLEDEASYLLHASKGGIIEYSLSREKNPKTLSRIAILDTITIKGDVDYGVGDQGEVAHPELGCESNIIVEGSIRGVFSIQSKGFIKVNKAIEGTVVADTVETDLITFGSSVTAHKKLTAGSIINATVRAETIIVKENTSNSALHASEEIVFEPGTTCMSLNAHSQKLLSQSTNFSGANCFTLGEKLFCEVEKTASRVKDLNKKIHELSEPLKLLAETVVDHLAILNSIVRKRLEKIQPEAIEILDMIKAVIVAGFHSVETSIDETITPAAYRLQVILGDNKFDDSVLRKVDLLLKSINAYRQKEAELAPHVREINPHLDKLSDLRNQLNNEITAKFTDVKLLSANSELRIYCGEAEQIFRQQDLPANTFTLEYCPPDDIENLRKGTLKISQ